MMKYLLTVLICLPLTFGVYKLHEHTFEMKFFVTYVGGAAVCIISMAFISWYESWEERRHEEKSRISG